MRGSEFPNDGRAGLFTGGDIPAFLGDSLRIPDGVSLFFEEGAVLRQRASVPDMYVYCMCRHFSLELMGLFGGACVEIREVDSFFRVITERLRRWDRDGFRFATSFDLRPCVYRERTQVWPDFTPYNPVFRKPPEYEHQAEVRAVWASPARKLSPLNLEVPEVADFCGRKA